MRKTMTPEQAEGMAMARLRVIKKLAPHARGAKALTVEHGEALVCVRHRLDATGRRRLTTVELVVGVQAIRRKASPTVAVKLRPGDRQLWARLEAAGARWNPAQKTWHLRRATAVAMGLKHRIVAKDHE